MIIDEPEVKAWLLECGNKIREDKNFQFTWKLIVSKLCYESACDCDWLGFIQACMQYDDPSFHLYVKGGK